MPSADMDRVVAALRSRQFEPGVAELANVIAGALSGQNRQQSNRRGLYDSTIVNTDGGTRLSVTDQSAARTSRNLQPRQLLRMRKQGAVSTRSQVRTDIKTRRVPAIVQQIMDGGQTIVVTPIDDIPRIDIDPVTGNNIPGNSLDDLSETAEYNRAKNGTLNIDASNLSTLPDVGDVVPIQLVDQYEQRNVWQRVNNRDTPRVFTRLISTKGYIIGDAVTQENPEGYGQEFSTQDGWFWFDPPPGMSEEGPPWEFSPSSTWQEGQPWCVFELATSGLPSGTLVRGDHFNYHSYGLLDSTLQVPAFTIPYSYASTTGHLGKDYIWTVMIGKRITGQNVLFGDVYINLGEGEPENDRNWTITDPNFPISF